MELNQMMTEDLMILDLHSQNKGEALLELTEVINRSNRISSKELFLKAIYEREELASTNMGGGVAIPHCHTDAVLESSILFARSKEGIQWDGDERVHFIFMLAISKNQGNTTHLEVIASLAGLLLEDEFIALLNETESKEDILEFMRKGEIE